MDSPKDFYNKKQRVNLLLAAYSLLTMINTHRYVSLMGPLTNGQGYLEELQEGREFCTIMTTPSLSRPGTRSVKVWVPLRRGNFAHDEELVECSSILSPFPMHCSPAISAPRKKALCSYLLSAVILCTPWHIPSTHTKHSTEPFCDSAAKKS